MNNDMMLVPRDLLQRLQERLDCHIDARDWGLVCNALLAAPAAQAVDEDSRKLHGKLIKLAAGLITGPISTLGDLLDEEKRMTRGRVSIAVDRLDADIKDAAYEIRQVADALHARAALAAPVQPACKTPSGPDCPGDGVGPCKLCPEAAPVQSEQEPVAVLYKDGHVMTKAECGDVFDICCKVETPLYAAPVRAVRLPDQVAIQNAILGALAVHRLSFTEGDDGEAFPLIDALTPDGETVAVGRDEIELLAETLSDAVAQLNAQPVGPES